MVAAMLAAGSVAVGAETNEVVSLAPVIVYGSRVGNTADVLPAHVQIFDAPAIAASGARDLPELLDKRANLQIRTLNANPLQAQVAMRGFGENSFGRVKVLVDGEELNPVDMEAPNLARIPLGGVTRVEVIPGPSPVLYGDGAVAGVINVVTDADDYARRTKIAARGGSYGTFGANFQTKGGFEEEGLLYSAVYDYVRSDGYRARTGYDIHSTVAGLRKNFGNGSTLGLKVNYSDAFYEMPGSLTRAQWKRDPRQALSRRDDCRVWNYGLALDSKMRLAEDQWLYLDGAFSVKHREADWGAYGYANEYDLYGWQLSPRYVNEKSVFGFDNKATVGFDFRYDRYEVADRSGFNNPHYAFDRARYALFAQNEFFFTDELSLLAGARAEYIDNRWDNYRGLAETTSGDMMGDYELGLVYRPINGLKTYVKGTRFHRSAFCDELNYTADGRFLEPETGTSLDLGLEYAFAKEWTFDCAGYWTVMELWRWVLGRLQLQQPRTDGTAWVRYGPWLAARAGGRGLHPVCVRRGAFPRWAICPRGCPARTAEPRAPGGGRVARRGSRGQGRMPVCLLAGSRGGFRERPGPTGRLHALRRGRLLLARLGRGVEGLVRDGQPL